MGYSYILSVVLAFVAIATAAHISINSNSSSAIGFINVTVATLWTNPQKPRQVDQPALTNPVQIEQWLDSMTLDQFEDLTDSSRLQAQGLYGTRVKILSHQNGWYEVAVSGEPSPKNSFGYPGWVPECQIATFDPVFDNRQLTLPFIIANKPLVTLYRDSSLNEPLLNITYGTRLPVLSSGASLQVAVPRSGVPSAFLPTTSASVYKSVSDIPYPTGEDLVNTAQLFYGRPYLWGGSSTYGFDCSGLTLTLYDSHGITIPRDADAQADFVGHGTPVNNSDHLQVGDLLFYASNVSDPSTIYHVAMFAGNGKMIEAFDSGIPVRITPVRFNDDYWGAERFLVH